MIVETTYGQLSGTEVNGIHSFKNIPYGATTGGLNRFRPPQKPQAWSGVRDASTFGPISPQPDDATPEPDEVLTLFAEGEPLPQSEDCLNLNVCTPGADGAKRPVMVWIHGGGLDLGSGNVPCYDGVNLARRGDVVVVTVTHRLGVLGYLYVGELLGADYKTSGNSGFLDLVASLEWVRDNIAAFGGDPDNVTIFGESGGGWKVSYLIGMPAAKGLFHKAIIQSGPGVWAIPASTAAGYAEAFLTHLGLDRESAGCLLELPFAEIAETQLRVLKRGLRSPDLAFGPVIDGVTVSASPFHPEATPLSDSIPILIGVTKHEITLYLAADQKVMSRTLTMDHLIKRIARLVGDEAKGRRLVDAYAAENPGASAAELQILIQTDANFTKDSIRLAERRAARRTAPIYMYQLAWESPAMDGKLMACHTLDVPLVFDNVGEMKDLTGGGPEAQAVADFMSESWLAFARSGNPQTPALPDWPAYDVEGRATMIFDTECRVERDPGGAARAAWR